MMKKAFLSLACLLSLGAQADEGMWTLYDLPQAVFNQMQAYGYELPQQDLYSSNSAIMKAVVNFSGYCSGVVVSSDGLVFTNHHCGFEAIRSHSTVEHDYMLNGFYAKTFKDELPNKDVFVSFMVEQKDVTDELMSQGLELMDAEKQEHFLDSVENAMSKQVKAKDSTLRLELLPFYEGNRYFATTYRDFTDVRLVFTVPKSMGKFGGETDNWMWPRQTCDFSVFRIYADAKTNGPSAYKETNVPYHPEHWARVSLDGYKEGSFAMTMGYPGSTNRYLSSYGIKERYSQNAIRAQVRGVKQEAMLRHMHADEAVRIKYDSKFAQSSNYWKNSIGMNKCIDSINLVGTKRALEQKIAQWQDKEGYLKGKLDFALMDRLYAKRAAVMDAFMYFNETFRRSNELCERAVRSNDGMPVKGEGKDQHITFDDNSEEWDFNTDREIFGSLLKNYRERTANSPYQPDFLKTIDKKFKGNCQAYADALYNGSVLMTTGKPIYTNKKAYLKDLGVQMGIDLVTLRATLHEAMKAINDSINEQERYLCAAKLRMEQDLPHYSDANFTMRLSYGQVKQYNLGGQPSGYYTDAPSIEKKMQSTVSDYAVEPVMKNLFGGKDFGRYADPTTGKMQLCYLTTNDITGGNSGSPVFDSQNRLIGLAFDGNWDSLSSDLLFDSQLARCICVDIRYMMLMMDKWGHADRLIKELQ